MHRIANLVGEIGDYFGIGNIPALGNNRHQQMILHQPADQAAVVVVEAMQFAKLLRIHGAEFTVIAAATLGDVVENGRQDQKPFFGN